MAVSAVAWIASAVPAEATMPGDPGLIAFSDAGTLTQLDPQTGHTATILGDDLGDPAWSPDGRRLAAVRNVEIENVPTTQLLVMNADGSNAHPIVSRTDVSFISSPSWSPDGGQIAYSALGLTGDELFTVSSAGGQSHLLVGGGELQGFDPAWSPDGAWIAFAGGPSVLGPYELYRARPDGSGIAPITATGANHVSPDWSPDGARLVFTAVGSVGGAETDDIASVPSSGGAETPLTSDHLSHAPVWSPDGSRVLLVRRIPGPSADDRLISAKPDGSDPRPLGRTACCGSITRPGWQPLPQAPDAPVQPPVAPPGAPQTLSPAPLLTGPQPQMHVTPAAPTPLLPRVVRLRAAKRPTLTFRLQRRAGVAIVLERRVGRRWRASGRSPVHAVSAGSHKVDVLRWVHRKTLPKGRYRATLAAVDGTGVVARRRATMTLTRPVGRRGYR